MRNSSGKVLIGVTLVLRATCIMLLLGLRPADDYYSMKNGKYLGSDGAGSHYPRLISEEAFGFIYHCYLNTTAAPATNMLQDSGMLITIDDDHIQAQLQQIRDLSMNGSENQLYILLDLKKARITSMLSEPGTNSVSVFEYYPAPGLGANMPVGPDGHRMTFTIILAGAHGHPDSEVPHFLTLPTMSPDHDAIVAHQRQIPVYGVDAMSYTGLPGSKGRIHRANPDGSIDNNIGWTRGKGPAIFNIGLDALSIWGRSGKPAF